MDMIALHILCCNPHAMIEMVQLLVENDASILSVQDVTGSTPLKPFSACQGVLGEQELLMPSLHDLLRNGIRSKEDLNAALILTLTLSRDLQNDVSNPDGNTHLTPFMSTASFLESGLDVVYTLAIQNVNTLAER